MADSETETVSKSVNLANGELDVTFILQRLRNSRYNDGEDNV